MVQKIHSHQQCKADEGDYHNEMNAKHFEEWLVNQLLPNIPPDQLIVMDNDSYHSANEGENVNSNSGKADMIKLAGKSQYHLLEIFNKARIV